MRNKELTLRRLRTLQGMLKQLDTLIHRGGSPSEINQLQTSITEIVMDVEDIVNREED